MKARPPRRRPIDLYTGQPDEVARRMRARDVVEARLESAWALLDEVEQALDWDHDAALSALADLERVRRRLVKAIERYDAL